MALTKRRQSRGVRKSRRVKTSKKSRRAGKGRKSRRRVRNGRRMKGGQTTLYDIKMQMAKEERENEKARNKAMEEMVNRSLYPDNYEKGVYVPKPTTQIPRGQYRPSKSNL